MSLKTVFQNFECLACKFGSEIIHSVLSNFIIKNLLVDAGYMLCHLGAYKLSGYDKSTCLGTID